ncbi:hypothetical protein J4Q44_G00280360 [Coregonus suidteri]|uniref:Lipase maturation factor n=1 Tax=Coregonus suidteri TaxID=861788 RepID=A0AAN8QLB8_9TELE
MLIRRVVNVALGVPIGYLSVPVVLNLLSSRQERTEVILQDSTGSCGSPEWVRGEHFKYKFSPPGSASAARGKWWVRKRIGAFFPAVDLAALRGYFKSQNWLHPDL